MSICLYINIHTFHFFLFIYLFTLWPNWLFIYAIVVSNKKILKNLKIYERVSPHWGTTPFNIMNIHLHFPPGLIRYLGSYQVHILHVLCHIIIGHTLQLRRGSLDTFWWWRNQVSSSVAIISPWKEQLLWHSARMRQKYNFQWKFPPGLIHRISQSWALFYH